MTLYVGVHPDDLRKYTNSELAKMYSVSERTISRAREYHGIAKQDEVVEFSEDEFRRYTRAALADKYGCSEHYIRKYAREQGWRKR